VRHSRGAHASRPVHLLLLLAAGGRERGSSMNEGCAPRLIRGLFLVRPREGYRIFLRKPRQPTRYGYRTAEPSCWYALLTKCHVREKWRAFVT
jgi:hypothetical protein